MRSFCFCFLVHISNTCVSFCLAHACVFDFGLLWVVSLKRTVHWHHFQREAKKEHTYAYTGLLWVFSSVSLLGLVTKETEPEVNVFSKYLGGFQREVRGWKEVARANRPVHDVAVKRLQKCHTFAGFIIQNLSFLIRPKKKNQYFQLCFWKKYMFFAHRWSATL